MEARWSFVLGGHKVDPSLHVMAREYYVHGLMDGATLAFLDSVQTQEETFTIV